MWSPWCGNGGDEEEMAEIPARLAADVEHGVAPKSRSSWSGLAHGDMLLRAALAIVKWLALVTLAMFILGPLIVMAIWAFAGEWTGSNLLPEVWSFKWWPEVLNMTGITDSIVLSLQTATIVMLLSAVICLPAAYAFARFDFRGRQSLLLAFLAANAFPKFGLYVTILTVFYVININDSVQGIVLIQLLETLVFMIWIPATAFQNIDRSLEEAALDAGCSRVGTFLRITLPLAAPAIAVAMLLSFVAALDESQGTLLVGLPDHVTMPLIMYNAVNSYAQPEGAVFALMLSIPSLLLLVVAQYLARGRGLRILGT
jgi:putative spermidine/putrescine transport system permease protein